MKINLTVNYQFMPDRVVELYKKFNGMDGETLVESRIQNSVIAYVKEVTPKFSVMDIYSDKKSEVNQAITAYLDEKLSDEYGIHVVSALVIDVELDETLMQKVQAKEQAKQMPKLQSWKSRRLWPRRRPIKSKPRQPPTWM